MTGRLARRIALAGALVSAAVAASPAETLTDALISAYDVSNLLEQNRAVLRAADEDVAIAVTALRPVLSYALSATQTFGTRADSLNATFSLSADMLLYDFGRSQLAIELKKETVLATREALVGIEQNVLYAAVSAYMGMIRTAQVVSLRENNVRVITQELRAATDRFELGDITRTDVSLAEARLALSRANLAAAQGDYNAMREQFNAQTGHYPGRLAAPPAAPKTGETLEAARALALRTHPSIRQAQHEVQVAEIAVKIAAAAGRPTLSVGARVGVPFDNGNPSGQVGLTFSGPIYQGGRLSAQYRQAVARRDAARAALLQTSTVIAQNVGVAWSQVAVSAAQLEASDRQIRASTVAYSGVREEAALGARTTLDVLNAEQELLDAQSSRISAYSAYYTATYALLREMGLLTVDHLRLGIVTYDPEAYYNAVRNAPTRRTSPQGAKLDRVLKGLGRN